MIPAAILDRLMTASLHTGLPIAGARIRRSSSRFCLGVEHGDYNGTDLFGVGTDRFIWLAYQANHLGRMRLFSCNMPDDGLVDFPLGEGPEPGTVQESWARFPMGVDYVLRRERYPLETGLDIVLYGNIPGGGMSRSASLSLNLIETMFEVNGITGVDGMRVVELAQMVENDYVGSPCGHLDQIMIYFAKAGMGTYYSPRDGRVSHVPLGADAEDFRIVSLDTGTDRPGLEKSTYRIRRAECEELVEWAKPEFGIRCLADVKTPEMYGHIQDAFSQSHPDHCRRLKYIYEAQGRFDGLVNAWKSGDIATVGQVFREDGFGLRDDYDISGPELEAMCEIARGVNGVLGERMLGGGDKGSSGAIVLAQAMTDLRSAVDREYRQRVPEMADRYAVHECQMVDGITVIEGALSG